MDIQKLINEVVGKLNLDASLLEKFKKDPMSVVKSLLSSINLDTKQLLDIIKGVAAKLNIDVSSLNLDQYAKQATGILAKIKALFSRK